MNKEQTLNEIIEIFKDILDMEDIQITEQTTSNDIDEWDSLTHIQLIVAIENHFKIKFSSMEIHEWKNVGEMMFSIDAKLQSGNSSGTVVSEEKTVPENKNSNIKKPSYRRNFITNFSDLIHGDHCFVSEGATLTNVELGDAVWVNKFATIYSSSQNKVKIGSNSFVGPYVWIEGHAGIEIGNFVHIAGPGTCMYTHSGIKMALNSEILGNPDYDPKNEVSNYFEVPIKIGNNVWIGPNCSISPGVVINDFVVIMPNTTVKSGVIESYSLVKGDYEIEKNSSFVKSLLNKKS